MTEKGQIEEDRVATTNSILLLEELKEKIN
jgi:hypothetical protein